MPPEKILIIDDERLVRWSLRQKCEEWGYHVSEAESGADGLRLARNESADLVLLDVRLQDMNGLQVLQRLKQSGDARAIIMITADPQLEDVKLALKQGAYDFIGKPIDYDELRVAVKNALEATQLRSENETLRKEVLQRRRAAYHDVVGESRRMQDLMSFVNKVASSEATTILIQGESGTGKDLISRAIHFESRRKDKPLIIINCSAIPETLMEAELFGHEKGAFTDAKAMKKGLFEQADGGTLFLDEIGELSGLLQAKLLRVLEEQVIRRVGGIRDQEVDVRVIAASNRDLERAVREGTFRQDLYYRLAIISLFLPPLRDRREDILPLVNFFIERYNRRFRKNVHGITPETSELLTKYDWPGNVRELKNAIERAMILEDEDMLRSDYLPFSVGSPLSSLTAFEHSSGGNVAFGAAAGAAAGAAPGPQQPEFQVVNGKTLPRLSIPEGGTSLEEIEHCLVDMAMQQANRNQTQAAKLLDISRDALRYKLKKFGLMHSEEE
jgi:two-component system, NtrC family, response regulator AtoC